MTDYGIKPEWREDWKIATSIDDPSLLIDRNLADLSLHLCAELKRERFEREHRVKEVEVGTAKGGYPLCMKCQPYDLDPRHNYQQADWEAEARKELGG